MRKVAKIEDEVKTLSPEELATFRRWFLEFDAEAWDREIEADIKAGRFDGLADAALEAHRSGKTTPL